MILRELVAIFGLDYDGRGQREAESGIANVQSRMDGLLTVARNASVAIGALFGAFKLAQLGSDAAESLNLLETIFEDNTTAVLEWSAKTGAAMGQSSRELQDLVGKFGTLLRPMIGNNAQLVEMTTNLAALSVDLTSLQNLRPGEAIQALRAGLSGSAEAVQKFGVDLRTSRVEAEALRMGINKTAVQMTRAEQATIRYNLLMKDLAFVQGDAMKTQDQFANALRGVQGMVKGVATNVGLFLIPGFESIFKVMKSGLRVLLDLTDGFMQLNANTNLALGLLITMGAAVAAILLPPLFSLLVAIGPIILAVVLLGLVIDEVVTTFQGGDSLINRFIDTLAELERDGLGNLNPALAALVWIFNRLLDAVRWTWGAIKDVVTYLMTANTDPFNKRIQALKESFMQLIKPISEVVEWLDKISVSKFAKLAWVKAKGFASNLGFGAGSPLGPSVGSGPVNAGPTPGPTATKGVVVNNETKNDIKVEQRQGESGEDLAKRIGEELDRRDEEKSQALLKELVPEPVG